MIETIIGLDLAATFQKPKVGLALVEKQGERFVLSTAKLIKSTREILDSIQLPSVLLAIDAPLRLPLGNDPQIDRIEELEREWNMLYTYRPWEHLAFHKLSKVYSISGRPFSSLALTYTAQILKGLLEKCGWKLVSSPDQASGLCFTEVFPNLTVEILLDEKKGESREPLEKKQEFVSNLFAGGYDISLVDKTKEGLPSFMKCEDKLDAIICAWTGALLIQSQENSMPIRMLHTARFSVIVQRGRFQDGKKLTEVSTRFPANFLKRGNMLCLSL
jgi:hypothetical protein